MDGPDVSTGGFDPSSLLGSALSVIMDFIPLRWPATISVSRSGYIIGSTWAWNLDCRNPSRRVSSKVRFFHSSLQLQSFHPNDQVFSFASHVPHSQPSGVLGQLSGLPNSDCFGDHSIVKVLLTGF